MQFELRTQVIEPTRKTFSHLVRRYGDRPASRYEEGTIDLQAVTNFHYRPLWDPSREIYSPDYSVLKLTDVYAYTDPRQFYYAPYVTARADLHEAFGSTLDYLEKRGMFDRLPPAWSSLVQDILLPLRHYEAAAQMISSAAARFGWGATITQCAAYAAFDRIGNAQMLSRVGISFGGGSADCLDLAKTAWIEADTWQPLRKLVEETLAERDWGKALIALDTMDRVLYTLFYTHLDDVAIASGAGSYSLVAQHFSSWFADQRRWLDALIKAWVADPEHGATNAAAISQTALAALGEIHEALCPVASAADALIDDNCHITLDTTVAQVRDAYAALGVNLEA
ncbi:MAG: phenol 2-monooxygenase [Actinomycetales bacterium]|nr:phenol 2-monooxygenase [Actinomycetales bacterium]